MLLIRPASILLSAVLGLLVGVADAATEPARDDAAVAAWCAVIQVGEQIRSALASGELPAVHYEDYRLDPALSVLLSEGHRPAEPDGGAAVRAALTFRRAIAKLHEAADAEDLAGARARAIPAWTALADLRTRWPADVLAAAEVLAQAYSCAMHPEEIGVSGGLCGKCGMAFDHRVRPVIGATGGTPALTTVTMTASTAGPLVVGQPAEGTITLARLDGAPVTFADLREVHTRRIHLLINDATLIDYHHEHPEPSATPGTYSFRFTPRRPGPYRLWADLRPLASDLQEYAVADLPAQTTALPADTPTDVRTATVGDLRFILTAEGDLVVGRPLPVRLRITTAAGEPFAALEPVMATFAHLVGFHEDGRTIMHIHPVGADITDPAARGGPELHFTLFAAHPGWIRLFAQIQVGGAQVFAPFCLQAKDP